jgi:tetratricopeptide (TPR) repeat protein
MILSAQFFRGLAILVVAAAGLGWFIWRTIRRATDPGEMTVKWIITVPLLVLCILAVPLFGPMGPFVIVACAVVFCIIWTPHIGAALAKPITSLFDGGDLPPIPAPLYSIARSRQKQGRALEAVMAIREQLQKFPTDLEGHLLLAQIQAEDLKDLEAAEQTIQRLVAQPGHAPRNMVYALYSLADWFLSVRNDRDSARRVLEQLLAMYPDSEFALGAAQRIAHLGSDEVDRKYDVTPGIKNLGLVMGHPRLAPETINPEELAAVYVKHLEEHPMDTEVREKLALLYAGHYQRVDLALSELEQMITQPNQPARLVNRWLNVVADVQVRAGADYDTVRATLERIIERDPNAAAAEMARNRIARVKLELKANDPTKEVKMGSYEQNIGLRQGGPVR